MKNKDARKIFIAGYKEMMLRLQPTKIIFFGMVPDECQGNIEHHAPYSQLKWILIEKPALRESYVEGKLYDELVDIVNDSNVMFREYFKDYIVIMDAESV